MADLFHLGDPVLEFFVNLPPLSHHYQKGLISGWKLETADHYRVCGAALCFLESSDERPSADKELSNMLQRMGDYLSGAYEREITLYLVQHPRMEVDKRPEARAKEASIKYYHLLARGRKDAETPWMFKIAAKSVLLPKTLGRLPVDTRNSWHGAEADGLLKMDHENPEVKKLYRAFSMYEEAFEMFLVNVYGARICKRHTSTTL